jgi:GNAT superfamily N-acetyltransferase
VDPRLELVEAEALAGVAAAAGLPLLRLDGGAVCTAAAWAPDNPFLNRACALGVGGSGSEDDLDEIAAFFGAHGVERYVVAPTPFGGDGLVERLRARGFEPGYAWMKFRRDAADVPDDVTTALRVGPAASGADFAAVVGTVFGMPADVVEIFGVLPELPGWHCLAAYDGDVPVAVAALFVLGRAAWLGSAGTLPEHRGRGAQSALLAARISLGRELGLETLTTETGEQLPGRPSASYRNILRAGFEEAYLRPNFAAPPGHAPVSATVTEA